MDINNLIRKAAEDNGIKGDAEILENKISPSNGQNVAEPAETDGVVDEVVRGRNYTVNSGVGEVFRNIAYKVGGGRLFAGSRPVDGKSDGFINRIIEDVKHGR